MARTTARTISTALKVLTLMQMRNTPLSSFAIGLYVQDPRRQISVIVRALARDGYIRKESQRGSRTAFWSLSDVGRRSLLRRSSLVEEARNEILASSRLTNEEAIVLGIMNGRGWLLPSTIMKACDLPARNIHRAIHYLAERKFCRLHKDGRRWRITSDGKAWLEKEASEAADVGPSSGLRTNSSVA